MPVLLASMAVIEHPDTGERKEIEGEIPFFATYGVEGYDEEEDEFWQEDRVDIDGESWIVIDDGVEMATLGSEN